MSSDNVASFACLRPHPQRGDAVRCLRSRGHAGDHRANDHNALLVWPDVPRVPLQRSPLPEAEHLAPPKLVAPLLDEDTEGVALDLLASPPDAMDPSVPLTVLTWLIVLVVATGWPPLLLLLIGKVG